MLAEPCEDLKYVKRMNAYDLWTIEMEIENDNQDEPRKIKR